MGASADGQRLGEEDVGGDGGDPVDDGEARAHSSAIAWRRRGGAEPWCRANRSVADPAR